MPAPHGLRRAVTLVLLLAFLGPTSSSSSPPSCALDGFDLTAIPPLTFTLPAEDTDLPSSWQVGFCASLPPPVGSPCPEAGSLLRRYTKRQCVADFPILVSVTALASGVRFMLQQRQADRTHQVLQAHVKVLCNASITGLPLTAMVAVRVMEDLGDYVLTFAHACACPGGCVAPLAATPPATAPPAEAGPEATPSPAGALAVGRPSASASASASPAAPPAASPSPLPPVPHSPSPSPAPSASPLAPPSPVDLCRGVACPPPDQCHDAGVCDPATGTCTNPPKPDGTACSDGNARTYVDQCQAGECVGLSLFCYSQPCKNGGRCVDKREACECVAPWGGPTCEEEVPDPCQPNPCANGGQCANVNGLAWCTCTEGYSGPLCGTAVPPPDGTPDDSPAPTDPNPPAEPETNPQPRKPALSPGGPPSQPEPGTAVATGTRFPWFAWVVVAGLLLVGALAVGRQVGQARGYFLKPAVYHPMHTDVEMEDMDVNPFAR